MDVRVPAVLSLSLSLFLPFSPWSPVCFLFLPFFLFCPLKITATPHRTEVNYSCAAGSRYLKYLGSRAAATAAATAAARHRHHRCASCGPLPQTRPTPRAPIGEGEEPMCARRLHRSILSSSLLHRPRLSLSLYPFLYFSLSLSLFLSVSSLQTFLSLFLCPPGFTAFVSLISFVFFFRPTLPLSLFLSVSLCGNLTTEFAYPSLTRVRTSKFDRISSPSSSSSSAFVSIRNEGGTGERIALRGASSNVTCFGV